MIRYFRQAFAYATRHDKLILLVCALATLGSLFAPLLRTEGSQIQITVKNILHFEGDLLTQRQLAISGTVGMFVVETGPSGARMAQSSCLNQICVRQGWQKSAGAVIVCVPNQAVVTITATPGATNSLDTITR